VRRFFRCASGAGGRPCHSAAARTGWHGVLAQRTPPIRAAAKRRRGLGQGRLRDGRERQSLRSPSGRRTAQRRESRKFRQKCVGWFQRMRGRADEFRRAPGSREVGWRGGARCHLPTALLIQRMGLVTHQKEGTLGDGHRRGVDSFSFDRAQDLLRPRSLPGYPVISNCPQDFPGLTSGGFCWVLFLSGNRSFFGYAWSNSRLQAAVASVGGRDVRGLTGT